MESEISTLLTEFGLDHKEILVYLSLVGQRELSAYRIAKTAKLNRSTVYDVLERLVQRGFVSKGSGNKIVYSANNLDRILSTLKTKELLIRSVMPKIESLQKNFQPNIRIFEGLDGQKEFNFRMYELIKTKKIKFAYTIGNTYAYSSGTNLFIENLIAEFGKHKIKLDYKGIWDMRFKSSKFAVAFEKLGPHKYVKNLPSVVGTAIYDDHVAFLYTADKAYVIEIHNSLMAEEFKVYFKMLWDKY